MLDGRLRVLVDGGLIAKPRGLGRYVRELVYALGQSRANDIDLYVLIGRKIPQQDLPVSHGIRYVRFPDLPIPIWEQILVPIVALWLRVDVVHCPCNTKSLLFNLLPKRHVVTLHDLIFMQYSGSTWYQKLGAIYRRAVVPRMFGGRMSLVTVSEFSSRQIEQMFGHKAETVWTAVECFMKSMSVKQDTDRPKLSPVKPYFVHIGGTSPHKNTARLIDAFLKARLDNFRLVVLGVPTDSALATQHACESVLFPGWVSDAEVARYIRGASAMLFPSLVEGYGLPIVEAFSLGCPVMTSNFPPMSELAGDAALLVDPTSVDELARGCIALAQNAQLRSQLISAGRRRLSAFSAINMGIKMIDIYRNVARI